MKKHVYTFLLSTLLLLNILFPATSWAGSVTTNKNFLFYVYSEGVSYLAGVNTSFKVDYTLSNSVYTNTVQRQYGAISNANTDYFPFNQRISEALTGYYKYSTYQGNLPFYNDPDGVITDYRNVGYAFKASARSFYPGDQLVPVVRWIGTVNTIPSNKQLYGNAIDF